MAWTEKKMDVTLHFSPSLVYMLMFYSFITINHIELCNTVDFSVHIAETACRLCSYLRFQSKILGRFCWKKKSPNVHFCVPAKTASDMNGWLPAPFYLLLSVRVKKSEVRRGSRSCQLHRVCWDCCRIHTALSCLVPVLKLLWNLIIL